MCMLVTRWKPRPLEPSKRNKKGKERKWKTSNRHVVLRIFHRLITPFCASKILYARFRIISDQYFGSTVRVACLRKRHNVAKVFTDARLSSGYVRSESRRENLIRKRSWYNLEYFIVNAWYVDRAKRCHGFLIEDKSTIWIHRSSFECILEKVKLEKRGGFGCRERIGIIEEARNDQRRSISRVPWNDFDNNLHRWYFSEPRSLELLSTPFRF